MLTVIMLKRKGKGDTNGSPNAYDIGAAEAAACVSRRRDFRSKLRPSSRRRHDFAESINEK